MTTETRVGDHVRLCFNGTAQSPARLGLVPYRVIRVNKHGTIDVVSRRWVEIKRVTSWVRIPR